MTIPFLAAPDLPLATAFQCWGDHRHLQAMIDTATNICVLSGAGLSAPSGLHTYRGQDGRWKTEEPVTHSAFLHDRRSRLIQWKRSLEDHTAFTIAEPNEGHRAIARLAALGHKVITQNIDGLHRRAHVGGDEPLELHGNGTQARCVRCDAAAAIDDRVRDRVEEGKSPLCLECGYILIPDIVLFGGQLKRETWKAAEDAAETSDLFIAVGTSLEVNPAAMLPKIAKRSGARLAILVDGVTPLHAAADLLIPGDAVPVLAAIRASAAGQKPRLNP